MTRIAIVAVFVGLACAISFGAPDIALAQTAARTDPASCRSIWEGIGLPQRKPDGRNHITTVCRLGYIAGHNDGNKTPDWVIERLTPQLIKGNATRQGRDFKADDNLPEAARAQPADYELSGFDQGHQAPADDFGEQKFLDDTFFLSNSVPQVGKGFNQSIWRAFETHVRKLLDGRAELYVITGPVNQAASAVKIRPQADVCRASMELPALEQKAICPENRHDKSVQCRAGVAIPAAMFKVVYDPAAQNAFAVLMTNENHTGEYPAGRTFDYIKGHAVGIASSVACPSALRTQA